MEVLVEGQARIAHFDTNIDAIDESITDIDKTMADNNIIIARVDKKREGKL